MTMNRLTALGSYRALPAKLRGAVKLHLLHGMPGLEACTALGIAHPARAWAAERVQRAIRDYTDGNPQMIGALPAPSCPKGCWDILNDAERADWPTFWRSLTPDRQDRFMDLHAADQWLWLDDWRDRQAKTPELSDLKTVENDPLKTNDLAGGCELEKRFTNDSCESAVLFDAAHVETLKTPIFEDASESVRFPEQDFTKTQALTVDPDRCPRCGLVLCGCSRGVVAPPAVPARPAPKHTDVSPEDLFTHAREHITKDGPTSVDIWLEQERADEEYRDTLYRRFVEETTARRF